MNKIAVLTDSAVNLPKQFMDLDFVYVAPLKVNRDGEEFLDGIDIDPRTVASEIDDHDFKTTLVNPLEALSFYNKAKDDGYNILLSVNLSSSLSGTFNSFRIAADQIEGVEVYNFDTNSAGIGAGLQVIRAIELVQANKSISEIIEYLEGHKKNSKVTLLPGSLKYLVKGGRLSKLKGTIGGILNISPILEVQESGEIIQVAKGRGFKNAITTSIKRYSEMFKNLGTIDVGLSTSFDEEELDIAEAALKEALPKIRNVYRTYLTPVLCIHAGPKNIVISIYPID
ncbi:MAG: DegV family protein [Erysipelotrichaceae bacterium]